MEKANTIKLLEKKENTFAPLEYVIISKLGQNKHK